MIKYLKYIIVLSIPVMLFNACKDSFLDEEVLDSYAPNSLQDQLGFEAAAIGLYYQLSTFYSYTSDQTLHGMFQLGTDIVWAPQGRSNGGARAFFDYEQLTPTNSLVEYYWGYLYKLINNANVLISNAESGEYTGMTEEEANAYNAEARFFRAYAYNELVTFYGDVPLILEPLTSSKVDFVREKVSVVNTQIETDLLYASQHLASIDNAGEARANSAMAFQLLAEFYLRTGEAAKAESACNSVLADNFQLVTERYGVNTGNPGDAFSDMFIYGNQRRSEGNTEVIWILEQENPTDVPGGSSGYPQHRRVWGAGYHDVQGLVPADSLGGRGLTRIRLDNWVLYDLYDDGDMRNSRFSIHRQHYFNDPDSKYDVVHGLPVPYGQDTIFKLNDTDTLFIFALDTVYKLAPYTLKWGQFDSRDVFGYGMFKDFILMRLGETYLLRAEARFQQGDTDGAADDINVLRDRAGAPNVSGSDITLDFILDERARELLAEENRRKTLVRTGTLVERVKRLNGTETIADGNIETSNGIQDYHVLLPIPQNEIDLNKDAELTQNTGYN